MYSKVIIICYQLLNYILFSNTFWWVTKLTVSKRKKILNKYNNQKNTITRNVIINKIPSFNFFFAIYHVVSGTINFFLETKSVCYAYLSFELRYIEFFTLSEIFLTYCNLLWPMLTQKQQLLVHTALIVCDKWWKIRVVSSKISK